MISIIICTYNREKYLYDALERIATNNFSKEKYEIVLIDNNSTDSTPTLCRRFHEQYADVAFRYFVETKQGLSHARNRGIEEAQGDIVVFLDDDSFIAPDYLSNLQSHFDNLPQMMAFGGKITPLFEDGKEPAWLCNWTYSWVSAIDMGDNVSEFPQSKYPIGANMGFRKSCLDQIGMFNTQLGRSKKNLMGGEEKDIFNRVHDLGQKIYYLPDIHVQHVIPPHRTTLEYITKLGLGVGMSEQLRCRNIGKGKLAKRIISEFVKWGATFLIGAIYLLRGRPAVGSALIKFRTNVTKGLFTTVDNIQ